MIYTEIESFRSAIDKLSGEFSDDRDFWPAYAEKANALEGRYPRKLRDYARDRSAHRAQGLFRPRGRVVATEVLHDWRAAASVVVVCGTKRISNLRTLH
jgi:hypothetical protein